MLDWGYAQFDIRHRLALSGVWVLPFARGAEGLAKALFADWQLNWIFTARTGYPFTVWDCTNGFSACARESDGSISTRPTADDRQPERVLALDLTPLVAHAGSRKQGGARGGIRRIQSPGTATSVRIPPT